MRRDGGAGGGAPSAGARAARRCTGPLLLALVTACTGPQSPPAERPGPRGDVARDARGLLIEGGTVVRRDRPHETLDLLFERRGEHDFLTLVAAGETVEGVASDTLHASGLFLHSAAVFEPTVDIAVERGVDPNLPMFVLREGASPASPARWIVEPSAWRPVEAGENAPEGPPDPAVGCYAVERAPWSDPSFDLETTRLPVWFPDTLRLHWRYQWWLGPGKGLVATDAEGLVRDPRIGRYLWAPLAADSVEVVFGAPYTWAGFDGSADAAGYVGETRIGTDTGWVARAETRLRRVPCPGGDEPPFSRPLPPAGAP